MISVDDIAAVVLARFVAAAAAASPATKIPGGAYFGRGDENVTAYPYVVFQIEAGTGQTFSGNACVQKFTVRAAAYVPVGATDSDPTGVQAEMAAALTTETAQAAFRAATLRNVSERIMSAKPMPASGKYEQRLRGGRDVFACGVTAELLCQGDRGAS